MNWLNEFNQTIDILKPDSEKINQLLAQAESLNIKSFGEYKIMKQKQNQKEHFDQEIISIIQKTKFNQ